MSRVIKFRAWDKEEGVMLEWYDWKDEIVDAIPHSTGDEWTNRCEVMQFTGLLDEKGKEIYEGDIVDVDRLNQQPGESPWRSHVGWSNGRFDIKTPWYSMDQDLYNWCGKITIIGNIHENLDLLKR